MKYIYDLHKIMLDKDLILVYEGEFTQDITKSVLSMVERNMDSFKEDSGTKRKVFNVMVECLQNISRHADNLDGEPGQKNNAIFMIGKKDTEYLITSGNAILNEKVSEMTQKLEHINSLDKQGLKEEYKAQIKRDPGNLNPRGGAGLGFIDMAKKSGQKLGFAFEPIDDRLTFFSLKTTVLRKIK